eukprot:gnl/TRDRNA2_/TRDRNA2_183920_c0_seq1.p1 gnl/TRDRNA2_/TRDRNA2_183920_c0~~gnl/TRDRNA2_/TRDRNA2_183920_c0_seq1.p1  ORF type:complete len:264 (+),score=46.86 gnl/TRDRNA2_/TRDRNA2_183920_c0_seq1:76-867(+)
MAVCPYGRASIVFPLCMSGKAALGILAAAEADGAREDALEADVAGYTTQKTREAGAYSVRLELRDGGGKFPEPGAHLVVIRAPGCEGWLPGLAGTRTSANGGGSPGVEVVVLGRANVHMNAVMYLPESTLTVLYPSQGAPSPVQIRFLRLLLPVQHDCPPQWLRDRLLRLADMVDVDFSSTDTSLPGGLTLDAALRRAGVLLKNQENGDDRAGPADKGDRISGEELGYWDEEMQFGQRCAGSMDGEQKRMDCPEELCQGLDGL